MSNEITDEGIIERHRDKLLIALESATSSHVRNMIITVGAGLTIFNIQSSNNKIDSNIVPLIFIVVGICEGMYALMRYMVSVKKIKDGTFIYNENIGYFYIALCALLVLTAIGFALFLFKKIL